MGEYIREEQVRKESGNRERSTGSSEVIETSKPEVQHNFAEDQEEIIRLEEHIAEIVGSKDEDKVADIPADVVEKIKTLKAKNAWVAPALVKGNKTATNYDSKVTNYSTVTNIVESEGQKYFVVQNYKFSGVHRALDKFMKKVTGCRMSKADSADWKQEFEKKSRIPTIKNEDPDTVIMPFVPNVNLYDLFVNRGEIKDFGECDFAVEMKKEDMLGVLRKITKKVKEMHGSDITWGELILPNMIIDKDQEVHICDPETSYNKDVPLLEQKARDLLDFITSAAAAMKKKNTTEYGEAVSEILKEYSDPEVVRSLRELASKKPSFLSKIFFGYTKARLGLSGTDELAAIRQAIYDFVI
jgi:tRNA A-37 threonylcarbamoyl transferase component Bud32